MFCIALRSSLPSLEAQQQQAVRSGLKLRPRQGRGRGEGPPAGRVRLKLTRCPP